MDLLARFRGRPRYDYLGCQQKGRRRRPGGADAEVSPVHDTAAVPVVVLGAAVDADLIESADEIAANSDQK
jgi:hypothetical protein